MINAPTSPSPLAVIAASRQAANALLEMRPPPHFLIVAGHGAARLGIIGAILAVRR